jgi:hypothetical protein
MLPVTTRLKLAYATTIALFLMAGPVRSQTSTAFNLTCTPKSSELSGSNTFGAPLTREDYQGIIDETIELAVDLGAKTSCHPRYCTPEQFGKPEPIVSVSAEEIVFDDIAAREVESNEYNVMAYRAAYQTRTQTLIILYTFFDEAKTTQKGAISLAKSCKMTPFALSEK